MVLCPPPSIMRSEESAVIGGAELARTNLSTAQPFKIALPARPQGAGTSYETAPVIEFRTVDSPTGMCRAGTALLRVGCWTLVDQPRYDLGQCLRSEGEPKRGARRI